MHVYGFSKTQAGQILSMISFTKELFPLQIAGTATGLVNLFPFAGGAVFQPLLGHILEREDVLEGAFTASGYRQVFLVLLLCGVFAFLASLFMRTPMAHLAPSNSPKP